MSFIQRILSIGIAKDSEITFMNRVKALNAFYFSMVFVVIVSIILSLFTGAINLLIIDLVFLSLFSLAYFIIPPYKKIRGSSIASFILFGLMLLAVYGFTDEIASNIMLSFFLVYPIIAATVMASRGLWISAGIGVFILLLNYFHISENFTPLTSISLAVFLLVYYSIVIVSFFIEKSQTNLLQKQARTSEYYESEIRQKDEFISQLSHKLRTSLSNITLINNLVHDSRMSSAQKELLDTLKTSTYDLINDVNELVEIATPAIIDFKQSILSFKLKDALNGTLAILHSDEDFNTEVQLKGVDSLGYNLIGDPSLLRSIFINLIRGGDEFKFTDDPVVLSVDIDYEIQNLYGLRFSLEFNVEDQAGLNSLLSNIQNKEEQRISKLSNANHLLALSASQLEYTFDVEGPVIYFFLDFNKDLTKQIVAEEEEKADLAQKGGKRSLEHATLLLVEDNTINQKIVLLSLDKLVKSIDVANNGKEALDMFGTKKYDLILMDIQMPVMDGLTATKKIREIESTSEERVPILAITANALAGDRDHCLAAGVDEYVSKPFSVDEIVGKINTLLNK